MHLFVSRIDIWDMASHQGGIQLTNQIAHGMIFGGELEHVALWLRDRNSFVTIAALHVAAAFFQTFQVAALS